MTKLVQPNVLRAYQSDEQYAINELVLYNGIPAYTNTALAQGVAGTAGNFTNIGSNTFSDSLFRIQDNDDTTKKIAFQASGVGNKTTKTISMPNRDVDLTATPFHKYVSGTSEVVPYSLGEVIYSIGGTGVSIDVTQMAMLKIRSSRSQPSIDSETTTAVTLTTTNANGQRLLDESRTTIGDIVVGTPLVITLKAFETWEIRQGPLVGLIQCFIVKKTFDPALIVGQMKIRNSLIDGLGWTTAGAVTTDRIITLPDANVDLGLIPGVGKFGSNTVSNGGAIVASGATASVADGTVILDGKSIITGYNYTSKGSVVIQGSNGTNSYQRPAVINTILSDVSTMQQASNPLSINDAGELPFAHTPPTTPHGLLGGGNNQIAIHTLTFIGNVNNASGFLGYIAGQRRIVVSRVNATNTYAIVSTQIIGADTATGITGFTVTISLVADKLSIVFNQDPITNASKIISAELHTLITSLG